MNEIGINRTVPVKTVQIVDGKRKLVLKMDNGQPVYRTESAEVWRVTRNELDGSFGRDRGRKLVVGFVAPDLVVLYPKGTRQRIALPLDEIYRIALVRKANIIRMAELRVRKVRKQQQRANRRNAVQERRFRNSLKATNV